MAEVDKVLEAQKAIESIAEELEKLGSTADLLTRSKEGSDAILLSSQEIIKRAGEFTTSSGEILQRLGNIDLEQKLLEVKEHIDQTKELVRINTNSITELNRKQFDSITESTTKNYDSIKLVQKRIGEHEAVFKEVTEKLDKQQKKMLEEISLKHDLLKENLSTLKNIIIGASVVILAALIFVYSKI